MTGALLFLASPCRAFGGKRVRREPVPEAAGKKALGERLSHAAEALRELYDQDIDGVVTSFIELDKDGNLQLLRWEQTEEVNDYPTVIACGEYSFS